MNNDPSAQGTDAAAINANEPVLTPQPQADAGAVSADETTAAPNVPETSDTDTAGQNQYIYTSNHFVEDRPIVEDRKLKNLAGYHVAGSFYNYGIDVLMYGRNTEADIPTISAYSPNVIGMDALSREKSEWRQSFKIGDDLVGVKRPQFRSTGGHVHGAAAIEMVRAVNGSGGTLTIPLIHTGIHITVKPADETAFIDTEFRIGQAATEVGTSTTGLLLNARSGVFSAEMIDLAISHVTASNLAVGADALHSTLMDILDPLDYSTLIWSVLAAKFVSGHPWNFKCTNDQCNHEREAVINFSRMLWLDKSLLSEVQLNILAKHQRSVTMEQVATYRTEWGKGASSEHLTANGIKIVFKRGTMRDYVNSSKRWISEIERQYANAMSTFSNEQRRNQYLNAQMQARRMRKYEHMVDSIQLPGEMEGEWITVDDRDTIREMLVELSAASAEYESFEEAAVAYIDANSCAIVGYLSHKCEVCNFEPTTADGPFRSIIPIATDRVLFMLVQQRNSIMSQLGTE